MANIVPSNIAQLSLAGVHSHEMETLEILRKGLPSDYTVFTASIGRLRTATIRFSERWILLSLISQARSSLSSRRIANVCSRTSSVSRSSAATTAYVSSDSNARALSANWMRGKQITRWRGRRAARPSLRTARLPVPRVIRPRAVIFDRMQIAILGRVH